MPTTSWCCATATCWSKARMRSSRWATAGMHASGSTNNCRRASMPAESVRSGTLPPAPAARARVVGDAAALLLRAGAPERRHVLQAIAWLLLAAGLEAVGPLAGKFLIDRFLLPRHADVPAMAALLGGALVAGVLGTWVRYGQLVRLAGVAMRSVQRIRESVYGHVLRLPMAFFDHAIIGQLVSRVTNDTEAVKTLYVQVLFVILDSLILLAGAMAAMLWLEWRVMVVVGGAGVRGGGLLFSFPRPWAPPGAPPP